jgi:hypothetical protein
MNDLLKLAIEGHGGLRRWELERFRAAASITGAIWALKGQPGLLDGVVLAGETRDQRLIISPFPRPGRYTIWEPYRQTIETIGGVLVAERQTPRRRSPGRPAPGPGMSSRPPTSPARPTGTTS